MRREGGKEKEGEGEGGEEEGERRPRQELQSFL